MGEHWNRYLMEQAEPEARWVAEEATRLAKKNGHPRAAALVYAAALVSGRRYTAVLESGFSGEKPDSLGRRQCYTDGKHVPCEGGDDGGHKQTGQGGAGGGDEPSVPITIPSGKDLQDAVNKGHKRAGPQGIAIVKVGDHEYTLKRADGHHAENEALASDLAVNFSGLRAPLQEITTVRGKSYVASAYVAGHSFTDAAAAGHAAGNDPRDAVRAAVAKVPRQELERMALHDYVVGFTDSHGGNYIVSPDNHLVGIDKGNSLAHGQGDKTHFKPPTYLHYMADAKKVAPDADPVAHQAGQAVSLSKAEVAHMIDAAGKIAEHLDSIGKRGEAKGVRARQEVLQQLAKLDKPTVGDLVKLGGSK